MSEQTARDLQEALASEYNGMVRPLLDQIQDSGCCCSACTTIRKALNT